MTLGQAARLLGVDETTLRAWADRGKIRVLRTAGGHRRFSAHDLHTWLAAHSAAPAGPVALGSAGHGPSPHEWMESRPWYARVVPEARDRTRLTCAGLVETLNAYLTDERERAPRLAEGRARGGALGREVAAWGLTPAQSTEVFLHFKQMVTDTLTARPGAMRDADLFLGEVLQAMLEAFEERRPARPTVTRRTHGTRGRP